VGPPHARHPQVNGNEVRLNGHIHLVTPHRGPATPAAAPMAAPKPRPSTAAAGPSHAHAKAGRPTTAPSIRPGAIGREAAAARPPGPAGRVGGG
jgi:hypothetical protein